MIEKLIGNENAGILREEIKLGILPIRLNQVILKLMEALENEGKRT